MLQKSDYLSLYCKMLANPSIKSELLTLFLQYFYPLSTFFCFCYIADCWHSLLFYFSMKKKYFPFMVSHPIPRWVQQVVFQFWRKYTARKEMNWGWWIDFSEFLLCCELCCVREKQKWRKMLPHAYPSSSGICQYLYMEKKSVSMRGWIKRLFLMKDQNNHFHWVYDTILKYNVEMSS